MVSSSYTSTVCTIHHIMSVFTNCLSLQFYLTSRVQSFEKIQRTSHRIYDSFLIHLKHMLKYIFIVLQRHKTPLNNYYPFRFSSLLIILFSVHYNQKPSLCQLSLVSQELVIIPALKLCHECQNVLALRRHQFARSS